MYSAFEEVKREIVTGDSFALQQRIHDTIENLELYCALFEGGSKECEIRKLFFEIEDTLHRNGNGKNLELLQALYSGYIRELRQTTVDGRSKEIMLAFLRQLHAQIRSLNVLV